MAHRIRTEAVLTGVTAEQVWQVWSDLPKTPEWDPRDDLNDMHGPFAPGTTGWFAQGKRTGTYTIDSVGPGHQWQSSSPLPGGRLVVNHEIVETQDGVRVVKTYCVSGPLVPAFAVYFARGIRREMPATFAALQAEARRRAATPA